MQVAELFSLSTRELFSHGEVTVMDVEGHLDINTVECFEIKLLEFVSKKKINIIINMKNLSFISSAGIGALMCAIAPIRLKHGDIKIANVGPEVYKIFELVDLTRTFQFFKTEQDALAAFGETIH